MSGLEGGPHETKCMNCGADVRNTDLVCPSCGRPLGAAGGGAGLWLKMRGMFFGTRGIRLYAWLVLAAFIIAVLLLRGA